MSCTSLKALIAVSSIMLLGACGGGGGGGGGGGCGVTTLLAADCALSPTLLLAVTVKM